MVAPVPFIFRKALNQELVLFDNHLPYMFPFAEFFGVLPFAERKGIQFHCYRDSFLPKNGMGLMEQKSGIHTAGKATATVPISFKRNRRSSCFFSSPLSTAVSFPFLNLNKLYHSAKQALHDFSFPSQENPF